LFSLRNSKQVLDQIVSTINTKTEALKERYGGLGADNISRFIEEYKNAINTFILQNFLSNNINSNGEIVLVPDTYKGFEVVTNENLETDVEVTEKDGKKLIRVNPKRIEADFKNKNYLVTSSSNNSYKSRGLEAFQVGDDVFESKSSYYRYVIEREYLKNKGFTKEELNSIALLNTYNPSVILRRGTYSFTDQLLESIQQFPELSKYPVVNQLSLYAFSNEFNVLTLNDKGLLDGAQADIYAQNIRELANPKIQKIANTKDNEKISRLFYMLQLMATYQHGSGPSIDGFNEILPQDSYLSVMNNASPLFTKYYFNEDTLEYIVDVLTADKLRIKNYTSMPTSNNTFVIEAKAEGAQPSIKPTTPTLTVNDPKDFTNHSGGAALSDTEWDQIGREFGVTNHKHYREPLDYVDTKGEAAKGSKTLDSKKLQAAGIEPTHISQKDYNEGAQKATKAFRMMYTDSENKSVRSAYIIRNWLQVKNADAIFALGTIKQPGENASDKAGETRIAAVPIVKGGTGYAVQMAINEGKPVYVFDGTKEGWYKYDYSIKNFVKTDTPTLTKNFAGIGSRTLSTKEVIDKSLQAIRDVYTQTFGAKQKSDGTTVKYKYYGAMYDIVVENGLGIDVLNYKGKPAKKAILLAYFNQNPNIDPQSTGPDPIVLSDEEINNDDTGNSDPTTGNTFTFADGYEIETPFKLNKEQEAALLKLEEFYNDPKKFNNEITLIGYAGTGKTSIMALFDKWLNKGWFGPNIVYTAPTHRANAVTKLKNPKIKVLTLHSLFGFGPEVDFEGMDYDVRDLQFANNRNGKIDKGQILIVDESSMITDELYDFLGQQKDKYDLKVIYMGDPGQLGPVQNKGGLTSKVFSNPTSSITLTKVERTGDNPILKESTALRSGGSLSYQSAEINGKGVEYINSTARENQILAENLNEMRDSENYLYFRMLAATNPEVARLNKVAREILYPQTYQEQLVVGEILMGYDNFGRDYKTGQSLLYNSGDYMITQLKKDNKEVYITNYEKQGDKFVNIGFEELNFTGYNVTLKNLLDPEAKPFEVFIPDIVGNDDASTKLADSIHKLNYMGKIAGYGQDKAKYFEAASNLSKQVLFMNDVKGLTDKSKIKKAIDYGYAHTIHKSQGGTYTKVFINDPSITGLVGYIKDRRRLTDDQAQTVERQLKYVAVSRATDYVYISTNRSAAGKPTSFDDPASGDFDTVGTFNINDLNPPSNPPISGERKPIEPINAQEIEDGLILQKGVLTKEEQKQFFQFGKTVLEKNGYNPFAQYVMASAGKMEWSPEFVVDKNGKGVDRPGNYNTGIIQIKKNLGGRDSKEKRWNYNYYLTNFDGTTIAPIPNNIISILEKVTGQDMSDYDTVLINLYPLGRTLGWHQDITEDYRNMDRDIISVSIGADADFTYNKRDKLSYAPAADSIPDGVVNLKSGDVMSFGGKSRLVQHTVTNVTGQTDLGTINLANSNVNKYFNGGLNLSNWRMNFTFRVADSKNNNGKRGLVSTVIPGIKKFEGQMTYAYGQNKRAGVIANTTFDAILTGERTATTRYETSDNIEYWKKAKVGDIITWKSDDGRTVDVEVTRPLHKLVGSGKTPTDWSQLEGWSISYFNEKVRPKLDKAWQIEFKLPAPPAAETEINDNFIDPFEDDQENNCAYPF
jgi:alkylated DNA repair dioxygenase AlkB